jgi:uncharacterized membrane protein
MNSKIMKCGFIFPITVVILVFSLRTYFANSQDNWQQENRDIATSIVSTRYSIPRACYALCVMI